MWEIIKDVAREVGELARESWEDFKVATVLMFRNVKEIVFVILVIWVVLLFKHLTNRQ